MSSPKRANYNDLRILSEFYYLRDTLDEQLIRKNVDPNDEEDVKEMIRVYILPQIRLMRRKGFGYLEKLKNSLQYYLNHPDFPLEAVYEAHEP